MQGQRDFVYDELCSEGLNDVVVDHMNPAGQRAVHSYDNLDNGD